MGVRFVLKDDHLTAILSGEIDHHAASGMREELRLWTVPGLA